MLNLRLLCWSNNFNSEWVLAFSVPKSAQFEKSTWKIPLVADLCCAWSCHQPMCRTMPGEITYVTSLCCMCARGCVCVCTIWIDVKLLILQGVTGVPGGSVTNEDTSPGPVYHLNRCKTSNFAGGHRGPGGVGDQRRHLPGTRVNVPAGLWWRTWAHLSRSWWPP